MKQQTTCLKYGIFTGVFLIVYFTLLGALGLINSPAYSIVNAFICAVGIFLAISKVSNQEDFSYKKGFHTGLYTGLYATVIYTIFFAIFAARSEGLITQLTQQIEFVQMNYPLLIITVAVMGLISIYCVTYILMKLFKHSWNLA